ncbi:MAG: ATP-binding protein [Pirellulaceae bacterium]|nr:ATP-binding protein [Pirellulaceae bacterium]
MFAGTWRSWLAPLALAAGCAAIATWQYREYRRECMAARESLEGQADTVMTVLLSGIRSHRRLGQFLDEQVQVVLDELTASEQVLAAAITDRDGTALLSAGDIPRTPDELAPAPGTWWDVQGLRVVQEFQLPLESGGGGGGRGGFGWGRAWQRALEAPSRFSAGATYRAIIMLDRRDADARAARAAQSRLFVALAGVTVVLCLAAVWRATVRLAQTRGALEAESRHLRELNQAAAGLAHETRNPLGLIRGWTQRLVDQISATSNGRQQAQAIVEECDRVVARINQFLAFARPAEPRLGPVSVSRLVGELAILLEPDLHSKGIALRPHWLVADPSVLADGDLLRQMLFNLIQNAVQWSPAEAPIDIRLVRGHNGRQRLEILDRGPGVSAEHAPSLFTPYFTTRSDGTGLGLAIVRRLANAHGWEVGSMPRPGGGSVFWIDGIHECAEAVHPDR